MSRRRPLSLAAYGLVTRLASPLARPLLEARARRGKEDLARLGERLGRPSAPRPPGPLLWLHAVSVGESVSLLPLLNALAARRPEATFLVTSGTRAAAEILAQRLPLGAIHQFAPIDTPGAVSRFLDHWRPDVGLFVESELWPNLILEAKARGVRLALVSARMTQKSARAWSLRPAAARAVLESFDLIFAQDQATAQRLAKLGAQVTGRLNLKRVGAPLFADPTELTRLKAQAAGRPVVVAVSTHPGEEALAAQAVSELPLQALLIIVPRHRERGAEVARVLAQPAPPRRAEGSVIGPKTTVYVADTLGEVGLFLRIADVAIMGGSFFPDIGGHNPLEPARLGKPVVSGPHVHNFADIYAEMAARSAARLVDDGRALVGVLAELLGDPAQRECAGAAALAFAKDQSDQLAAALPLIDALAAAS